MKKKRIGKYVIVGTFMILTGVVGVSAANTLTSNGVLYSNAGSSVTTVEGALNELYANYNSLLAKGNASASEILSGKTALVKGKEVTGTMPNNGSVSKALTAGGSYTIPAGYHDGTGKVTANTLASQTSGTAVASNILSGKTAYVNGSKVTGTMQNYANNWIWTDKGIDEYTYNSGAKADMVWVGLRSDYSDIGSVNKNSKFIVGTKNDIKNVVLAGKNFLGVDGTATSDANATASQILSGKTAYVNGSKVTGTIASLGAKTYTPGTSNQTIASGKYLSGAQTIKGDSNLVASNIKKGTTIFGVTGTYEGLSISSGGIHVTEVGGSYCGSDWYLRSDIGPGTYIVTNSMYFSPGIVSGSDMSIYKSSTEGADSVTLLSSSKSSYMLVSTYKVILNSARHSGVIMGRMSNCASGNYGSIYGKSSWVKVSA